jgi:hypothetical protein
VTEAAGGIGLAHLLRALRQGRIAFLPAPADTSVTKFKNWVRITAGRPAVALIGDDDLDQGPSDWPVADRAVAWAKSILIHAAGAEISHCETAVIAAEMVQRVLIIECGTTTMDRWITLVRAARHRPPFLVIRPRQGVHPIPLDRSRMQ